ncbi:MAG: amidohydrolase, partial [Treponemataceae bacterium]|nr:amidohydrolase [Treponemataceae bacterium]
HPGVRFVMAHLGLGTDNSAAIEAAAETPNLYGDTAWVPMEGARRFLEKAGSGRLLFGSDLPIDGLDTYHHNPRGERSVYQDYFHRLPALVPPEDYENVMWRSAARLFGLPF